MVRFLDRADELEHSIQHRCDFDADAYCLSLCRGYSAAALALYDAARCFLSNQHPACFLFFSLIEVLITTILDNNQQIAQAKKLDRYCRVIVPVIFVIASIAIFAHPRA